MYNVHVYTIIHHCFSSFFSFFWFWPFHTSRIYFQRKFLQSIFFILRAIIFTWMYILCTADLFLLILYICVFDACYSLSDLSFLYLCFRKIGSEFYFILKIGEGNRGCWQKKNRTENVEFSRWVKKLVKHSHTVSKERSTVLLPFTTYVPLQWLFN